MTATPPLSDRLDAEARDAAACRQIQRERNDPAAAATIAPGEPAGSWRRVAAACVSRPDSTDDDITSSLRMAAAAGSIDAERTLLIDQLHQDEADVDAVATEGTVDREAVRGYYDHDLQALRALALGGDRVAAQVMASVWEDGKLIARDPAMAAAWKIFANQKTGQAMPGDDALQLSPELDDLDTDARDEAIAAVRNIHAARKR